MMSAAAFDYPGRITTVRPPDFYALLKRMSSIGATFLASRGTITRVPPQGMERKLKLRELIPVEGWLDGEKKPDKKPTIATNATSRGVMAAVSGAAGGPANAMLKAFTATGNMMMTIYPEPSMPRPSDDWTVGQLKRYDT